MTSLLRPRRVPRQRRPLDQKSWDLLRQIDQELHADNVATYADIRKQLDDIPTAQRGIDWAERVVKLYCCKMMKAQRCNGLIQHIGELRHAAGQKAHHTTFLDELRQLTAPHILTLHGYTVPLRNLDQTAVVTQVQSLMSLLTSMGFESFINSGTLLGAVREGQLLGHDDDVDLAVLIAAEDDQALITSFIDLCEKLNGTGALDTPATLSKGIPVIKIKLASGVWLDLFPAWMRDSHLFIWPYSFGALREKDVLPLAPCQLNGIPLPAPREAQKVLALNYGSEWRSPDVHFTFPWKAARQQFSKVIRHYQRNRRRAAILRLFRPR